MKAHHPVDLVLTRVAGLSPEEFGPLSGFLRGLQFMNFDPTPGSARLMVLWEDCAESISVYLNGPGKSARSPGEAMKILEKFLETRDFEDTPNELDGELVVACLRTVLDINPLEERRISFIFPFPRKIVMLSGMRDDQGGVELDQMDLVRR